MHKAQRYTATLMSLLAVSFCFGQAPANLNEPYNLLTNVSYIRTWDATMPESNGNVLITKGLRDVKQSTAYVDGLGRPLQTVIKKGSLATDPQNPGSSSAAIDFVNSIVYDEFGREHLKYLPFASTATDATKNNGLFKLNPFQQQATFYNAQLSGQTGETNVGPNSLTWSYNQTVFEASPLNRVTQSLAPGSGWIGNNKSVGQSYDVNALVEVRIWKVSGSGLVLPVSPDWYDAGMLYRTVITDEHGKRVVEYQNKTGQVVLKKIEIKSTGAATITSHTDWLNTYYIYDDLNRLRFVIPPKAVDLLSTSWTFGTTEFNSSDIAKELCFVYDYDAEGRLILKKVPGASSINMIYDQRNRLVMTQDALLHDAHQWLYTQYDSQNRPIATGLITDHIYYNNATYHRGQAQSSIDYPNVGNFTNEELTRTFYDKYTWLAANGNPFSSTRYTFDDGAFLTASNSNYPYAQPLTQSTLTEGMVTGSKVKVLGTTSQYLYSINYYDDKGRIIQTQAINITGCNTVTTTQYSFSGEVLVTYQITSNCNGGFAQGVLTHYEYDDLWRLSRVKKQLFTSTGVGNTGQVTILQNEYDALGQLKRKKLAPNYNSGMGLETQNFDYNIRGWIMGMNRDYIKDAATNYFGFELGYEKTANIIAGQSYMIPQYNGNIAGTTWKSKGDGEKRKYDFTYDPANRILSADFNQYTSGGFNKNALVDFSLSNMSYDLNGNIGSMRQKGLKLGSSSTIDDLSYNYIPNTNKLLNVIDGLNDAQTKLGDFRTSTLHPGSGSKNNSTVDYSYDGNGNLVKDLNKDIITYGGANGIEYNHLNLPKKITVRKANGDKGTIEYTYDALGNKLKKTTTEPGVDTTVTLYIGGSVYQNDTLQFISHEEGRIRFKPAAGSIPAEFVNDYFIKDHLGNVRMVLTDEQKFDQYPTLTYDGDQDEVILQNKYWENLDGLSVYINSPGRRLGRPPLFGNNTTNGTFVQKVQVGHPEWEPAKLLKVMSGDKIHVKIDYYYTTATINNSNANGFNAIIGGLASFLGSSVVSPKIKGNLMEILDANYANPDLLNFFRPESTEYQSDESPKAYLHVLFFDEMFKFDAGNSYVERVASTPGTGNISKVLGNAVQVKKNGYAFVYFTNQSNTRVYIDNLALTHERGPILEETHYYPFGLTMAGISSKALAFGSPENKYKYNGIEKENDLGLEVYDAQFRELDAQVGRWWQIDPKTEAMEMWSPYVSNYNNPIRYSDPLGDEGTDCCEGIKEFFVEMGDRASRRLGDARDWVGDTWDQAGKNFRARWNERADPLHQALDNPFSMITGIGPLKSFTGVLVTETKVLTTEITILENEFKALSSQKNIVKNEVKAEVNEVIASKPTEAYNRTKHYGKTPTATDRKVLGAKNNEDIDHTRPLVKHYYEGDGKGGRPGYQMTAAERKTFAKDRTNMTVKPSGVNKSEGAKLSEYSKAYKRAHGLYKD